MKNTVAVIQARMGSTRLPGKVLKEIERKPALQWVVDAAERARLVNNVIVATSTLKGDDVIADYCKANNIECFRGSETDVLSRYLGAALQTEADIILRLTGDCPFLDPRVIDEVVALREMKDVAYATNTDPPTYPDGLDVEVFTRDALECANREAIRGTDRDCVTRFLVRNRHRFPAANLVCPLPGLHRERWVLDSPEDLEFLREVAKRLALTWSPPPLLDVLRILNRETDLRDINKKYERNERFYDDLINEKQPKRSFEISKQCLVQSEAIIPLGAQTFSKSKLMFPEGAAPLFLSHGDGGYCYDVDGNDYVDLVGGLLPNILGYRDPDVDAAIRDQISRGITFSLATTLEEELAAKLCRHIPSAEQVKFGKNGSDVTSAAVRLARHITGRNEVYVGGYHGWHDWSLAVNRERNNGIPWAVQEHSHKNLDYVGKSTAALVVEPEAYNAEELREFRDICDKHGILLVFDEIISGFRCGMGGLQAVHGVTPDLSTFGKAMANGMPLSALVGKEEYMKRMAEVAFSGTFFGEALSLAAGIATIDKLAKKRVCEYLGDLGTQLRQPINELIEKYKVDISLYGPPHLNRIKFADKQQQSLFIQEMAKNGVLIIGSHNTCYAHKKPQMEHIVKAWDRSLCAIANGAKLEGGIIRGKAVR